MTTPAGRAAVEIVGDWSKFASTLQSAGDKALRSVNLNLKPVSDQITAGLEKGVAAGGRALDSLPNTARAAFREIDAAGSRAFNELGDEARQAGVAIVAGLRTGTTGAGRVIAGELADGLPAAAQAGAALGEAAAAAISQGVDLGVNGVGSEAAREIAGDAVVGLGAARPVMVGAGAAMGESVADGIESKSGRVSRASGLLAAAASTALLAGAAGLGAGLIALTGFGLKSAAALEQTQISFNALTGSAQAGQAVFTKLQKFAAETPFDFPEVADAAKRFLAFNQSVGLSDAALEPFLTTVGNLASVTGAGAEGLARANLALGQIASAGRVQLGDITQLSQAFPGFSGVAAIAAAKGISTAEAMKQISAGTIDAEEGVKALLKGMAAFPGAAGAMAAQAQTLLGVFSTFKDTASQALSGAFAPVIPEIKKSLTELTPVIGSAFATLAPALGKILAAVLPLLGQFVKGIVPVLTPILTGLAEAMEAFGPALAPLGTALGLIAAAVAPLLGPLGQFAALLAGALGPVLTSIAPLLAGLAAAFTQVGGVFVGLIVNLAGALPAILDPLAALAPVFANIAAAVAPVVMAIGAQLGPILDALAPIIEQLLVAFLPLLPIIGDLAVAVLGLAPALLSLLVPALQLMLAVITPLVPLIGPLADVLGGALGGAIGALAPVINALAVPLGWLATFLADNPALVLILAAAFGAWALAANGLNIIMHVLKAVSIAYTAVQWLLNVAMDANPIGLIIIAVAALVAAIVWVATKTQFFQTVWSGLWDQLKAIGAWFAGPFANFFVAIGTALATAFTAVVAFISGVGDWFSALPGRIGAALLALPGVLLDALNAAFQAALFAIGLYIGLILAVITGLPPLIWQGLQALPGLLRDVFVAAFNAGLAAVTVGINAIVAFVGSLWSKWWQGLQLLPTLVHDAFFAALHAGVDAVMAGVAAIVAAVGSVWSKWWQGLQLLPGLLRGAFFGALHAGLDAVRSGVSSVVSEVMSVPGKLAALPGRMLATGRSIISALLNGLKSVGGFAGDIAGAVFGALKASLNSVIGGINSGIASVDAKLPISLPRIPMLAEGGFTLDTGLAVVHPRELVLPLEDARVTDLLGRALAQAQAGLAGVGIGPGVAAAPAFDVRVFIGNRELTDIVDVQITERDRAVRDRVLAGAGRR